jgi:hypothetical protein
MPLCSGILRGDQMPGPPTLSAPRLRHPGNMLAMHMQSSNPLLWRAPSIHASVPSSNGRGEHGGVRNDSAATPGEQIRSALELLVGLPAEELYASLVRQIRETAMAADIASSTEHKLRVAHKVAVRLGARTGLTSGDGPDEDSSAEDLYVSLVRLIREAAMAADIASSTEHKLKTAYKVAIGLGAKTGLISGKGLDDELRRGSYLLS